LRKIGERNKAAISQRDSFASLGMTNARLFTGQDTRVKKDDQVNVLTGFFLVGGICINPNRFRDLYWNTGLNTEK
jgi:hypothetical protein